MLTSAVNPCFIPRMAPASNELLTDLLRDVSRSFYLTLRVLPKSIRPQIGLAYLLARTTDTIADTELVPVEQRLRGLQLLRHRILGTISDPMDLGQLAMHQGSAAERVLLEKCDDSLALLESLDPADRQRVRDVLDTITSGQELDLQRFAGVAEPFKGAAPIALRTDEELDDYTYRVAGCVGEFWTKMCRAHVFPAAPLDDSWLLANGVRFGKGLQLVNILRDLPADLQKGRCYLPGPKLSEIGLAPADLLQPANEPKLRPLYNRYLDLAQAHLTAGWEYTNALPWSAARVRLACAWPILIGLKTIERLRTHNVLDPQQRIKISRGEVRGVMVRSLVLYPFRGAWRKLAAAEYGRG
jgi:farnesyl-diphosphate farnesyltransferase